MRSPPPCQCGRRVSTGTSTLMASTPPHQSPVETADQLRVGLRDAQRRPPPAALQRRLVTGIVSIVSGASRSASANGRRRLLERFVERELVAQVRLLPERAAVAAPDHRAVSAAPASLRAMGPP